MIPENFKQLIDKLKARTLNKEAFWNKTSRDNEFKLDLGKGAITIDSWNDQDNFPICDLTIFNDRGDAIDRIFYYKRQTLDYEELLELHTIAKRAYYKVDETFKDILRELDSANTIGKKDDSGDDLPF